MMPHGVKWRSRGASWNRTTGRPRTITIGALLACSMLRTMAACRLAPGRPASSWPAWPPLSWPAPAAPPRLARRRDSRAAPSSRPRTSGTAASTGCPSIHVGGPETQHRPRCAAAPRLRLVRRLWHPLERGRWRDRRAGRLFHVARRIRRGAVPHPAGAADRGRQRPPSPDASTVRPVASTSSMLPSRRPRAGAPAPARSGTCARMRCARSAGRAPMRRACPSCPAWCAIPRWRAARSPMRCASRPR